MRKLLFLVSLAVLVAAALIVPTPLLALGPGPSINASERVSLADTRGKVSGELLLTTATLSRESLVGAVGAWLDPDVDVLIRPAVIPPGVDADEYVQLQRRLFEESVRVATAVGLERAGYEVGVHGQGARVEFVLPGSPADGKLEPGDIIVAADGRPVRAAADLVAATSRTEAGQTVSLTVERGDRTEEIELEITRVSALRGPGVGVGIRTMDLELDLPVAVDIHAPDVGGASGGLMLALAVYDQATDDDLTGGRVIAGTGTVGLDGRVGPVGGVDQKVAAAQKAGASLFFVPEAEADIAEQEAAGELRVAPVSNVDDAIGFLRD